MSMSTIRIHRDFPVINGFVQVPPNKETDKNRVTTVEALTAIDGSIENHLTVASGNNTGWKAGAHSFVRLPGLIPGESYLTATGADPIDTLAGS